MDNSNIINEANTYLNSNMTVNDTAKYLGISRRTFQLHLRKLELLNPDLYKLVIKKQKSNIMAGRSVGGRNSKRLSSYSKEEAISITNEIINNQMTYRDAELKFNIPSSTIYDITHSDLVPIELRDMLDIVADANRKGVSTELFKEEFRLR